MYLFEKFAVKHGVSVAEVEQVLFGDRQLRRLETGRVIGEDVYAALRAD